MFVFDSELHHLKESFGPSNELIISLQRSNQHKTIDNGILSSTLQQEAEFLASYNYEKSTLWRKQIGYLYKSLIEDYFAGFILHCKEWKSIFCNPSRSAFLGSATSSLNDTLVQGTRWNCGLLEPFYSLPSWCLATVPQLCLINGISLYPKVSSPWFMNFSCIFLCSLLKHLLEVLNTGGSVLTWCSKQRIWMIKSITCYTYATIDAILKCFGMKQPCFSPTNKVSDDEQAKLHQLGKFNFHTSTKFLAPLVTLVMLNMIAFTGGIARMVISGGANELLGQVILSFYILLESYPIIEVMAWRKDKGQVPASVALLSFVLSIILLLLGSVVLRLI
ncbi:hypothetical protein WN944_025950 [Citrus x changshan-huyou]|uniref:Uncharacterized protein n=1 Tax=Citrus x changshan-huyou TaxID=2935761 RepID=A0AAP0LRJ3_9ROSI